MYTIKEKTIAVASGKGGVGKTTTSVNIALLFAKKGLKTAIIDIDPLSDISTFFDIQDLTEKEINDDIIEILPGLDLIFPQSKTNKNDTPLIEKLDSIQDSLSSYDKIILDLPAGTLFEENLIFLQYTSKVIIVTNDEPTSHTASGFYIKKAYESGYDIDFFIWHNKYAGITVHGFDPHDLPGNYNRNVSEEDSFDFSKIKMKDAAFIPCDSSMDLLKNNSSLTVNILSRMIERIEFITEQRINELSENIKLPKKIILLITHYLYLNPFIKDAESVLEKISEFIFSIINSSVLNKTLNYNKTIIEGGLSVFTDDEKSTIYRLIKAIQKDSLINELLRASVQLKLALGEQNNSNQFIFSQSEQLKMKSVDRKISLLLQMLNAERNEHNEYIKTTAALLQFDFTMHKLFLSKTVTELIAKLIPQKNSRKGIKTRDKYKQILLIVQKDSSYNKEYLKLINILFPVVLKQLTTIAETFNTSGLIFKTKDGLQKKVYLKLLSSFLHNTLNSGLGIVIGFSFRPASEAFEKYTNALL